MEVPEPDTGGVASREQQFCKQLLICSENIACFLFRFLTCSGMYQFGANTL